MKAAIITKLDLNQEFFTKENFQREDSKQAPGGYYFKKQIRNYLITFNHLIIKGNEIDGNVCVCNIYFYINANIAGFALNSMPIKIRSNKTSDLKKEFSSFKEYFNL